jgi:hypothetical protein
MIASQRVEQAGLIIIGPGSDKTLLLAICSALIGTYMPMELGEVHEVLLEI